MRAAANKTDKPKAAAARGFSLVELALALFVFALVISSVLAPAAELFEKRRIITTREYIARTAQAVMEYSLRNRTEYRTVLYGGVGAAPAVIPAGRPYLPCPDIDGDGIEDREVIPVTIVLVDTPHRHGKCESPKGTIPYRTLQLLPEVDTWGNYLTYHVDVAYSDALFGFDETSRADSNDISVPLDGFTSPPQYRGREGRFESIVICNRPPGNAATCDPALPEHIIGGVVSTIRVDDNPRRIDPNFPNGIVYGVSFVLISHGKNGKWGRNRANGKCTGTVADTELTTPIDGAHERRNGYGVCGGLLGGLRQDFYFSYPTSDHPVTGEFDDIVHWVMAPELMGFLNDAGRMRENEAEARSPLPIPKLNFLPRPQY